MALSRSTSSRSCVRARDKSTLAFAMPFMGTASRNCLSLLFSLVPEFINLVLIGHFGSVEELGAVGLGTAMQSGLALSVAFGLNTAFDTFTTTSGGAGATRLSMVYLARGRIAVTLYFVLISPVLWYTDTILLALHQSPVVAQYAADYNRVSLIGLWFVFQWDALERFLQNRGETRFVTVVQVAVSLLHITWCYLYVGIWGLGNTGVGLANSTSWIVQIVILEAYFRYRHKKFGIEDARWMYFHWDSEAWSGMGSYFATAIPAAFLMWAEWSWWEILAIIVGLFGEVQLAAHVIAANVTSVVFMIPFGLNVTASYFFGNAIGQGNAHLARRYMRLSLSLSFATCAILSVTLYVCSRELALLYTRDEAVLAYLVPVLCVYAFTLIPDGMQIVLNAIIRVCERQNVAAVVVFVENFVVSFGLALLFCFYWHGGIVALWWACFWGMLSGSLVLGGLVYFTIDIDQEVQRAVDRIKRDEKREPLMA
eukprot:GEMP01037902.1.p1 GENE.GEMP01037902.1~~GEMP01037902.1.p1  ORF type:complete len:482 (+),score=86.51 GEMP01037902.1:101-1546(+)